MREPGGANAVVHSPLHKYKNFQIQTTKKKAAHSELPLFINGKVAGNVNIAFLNLLTGGFYPGTRSDIYIPLT